MEKKNVMKNKIIEFAIINYRLSMDSVYELFNIEKIDDAVNISKVTEIRNAIRYILEHETINDSKEKQKEAKRKTLALITKLKMAASKKNTDEVLNLLINPEDIKALKLKNKEARYFTEEDKECLFAYRYRYALKIIDMQKIFPFGKNFYVDNEKKLKNEFLKNKIIELNDYHTSMKYNYRPKQ